MPKFKPARPKKTAPQRASAIGCIVALAMGFFLLFAIMYYTVTQK